MEIKVKIHRLFDDDYSSIRGTASMTLDGVLAVHGIKIMSKTNGATWVALPSAKSKSGYYDVVHPLTAELRRQINSAVLSEYKRVRESGVDVLPDSARETEHSLFDTDFGSETNTE